jgi:anti-anti-sigma factor
MELQFRELDNGIRLLELSGELDMNGTYAIEVEFVRHCNGENARILVDLSKVSYISSIGIPMLVNSAKLVERHGGRMALLNPQKSVEDVLEMAGIPLVIPVYYDFETAKAALLKED